MPECVLGDRTEPHLVDEFRCDQRRHIGLSDQRDQQVGVESGPDDRRGIQRSLRGRVETVDAGADSGVKSGWDIGVVDVAAQRVGPGPAVKHAALSQVADHLLGEERVTPRALGNPCGQVAEWRIGA